MIPSALLRIYLNRLLFPPGRQLPCVDSLGNWYIGYRRLHDGADGLGAWRRTVDRDYGRRRIRRAAWSRRTDRGGTGRSSVSRVGRHDAGLRSWCRSLPPMTSAAEVQTVRSPSSATRFGSA